MSNIDPTLIDAYKRFSTCDVSDALVKLGHLSGGLLVGISMWSPERQAGDRRIVGRAYTVRYDYHDRPSRLTSTDHYIDGVGHGDVILITAPPGVSNTLYGGLMTRRALRLGAAGTVINGKFRDLDEQRAQDFPIFAKDVGTCAPGGRLKVVEINGVVELQESDARVAVKSGDLLIGDLNGVVHVEQGIARAVLERLLESEKTEHLVADALDRGESFSAAVSKYR